jgi:hypothetical protein
MNSGFTSDWELMAAARIRTGRQDIDGCSVVLLTLSESLEIELSDFETENATLKDDYLWQVVEIVIGGVLTVLDVRVLNLVLSLGGILLQGSILTYLFGPMGHQVDLQKVEVGM